MNWRHMKAILATILLTLAGLSFSGCESDVPPDTTPKKGPIGDGSLVQPDKSEDPVIREETRVGY
jgi:homogentisate 1,2-dioxygenase